MAQLAEELLQGARDPGPAGTQFSLLLVDDDPKHRTLYARRLRRLGYTVRTAAGATEAVASVQDLAPDAVVLDIAMPGRDGLSVLQEMVALRPTLPVILHTAYPGFRDNFLAWAADAYVEKSADIGPLAEALETALSRRTVA